MGGGLQAYFEFMQVPRIALALRSYILLVTS
jgi:hypothetical protein